MKIGQINILAGGAAMLAAAFGGFLLGFSINEYFASGQLVLPLGRSLLKSAHSHAMPIALFNIIVGVAVNHIALNEKWKKACSYGAVIGLLMPVGLVLRGLQDGAMTFAPVVMLGAMGLMLTASLLVAGSLKGEQAGHQPTP